MDIRRYDYVWYEIYNNSRHNLDIRTPEVCVVSDAFGPAYTTCTYS